MRVLIVEDEAITAMVLVHQLEALGAAVVGTAASGEQACALATAHGPDAIVMDIGLAGDMDGIAAAASIRQSLDAPIVFASGYTTADVSERARNVPNSAFLGKPADPKAIHALLQQLLENGSP